MRLVRLHFIVFIILILGYAVIAQDDIERAVVDVPKVNPSAITIDGVMDETEWNDAAKADLITSTGFDGWFNYYYDFGEAFTEPDYDEVFGRILWSDDTLYVFLHVDEIITDSTDLYFAGQWGGDQMFVGLSSRLGMEYMWNEDSTGGAYNGWPFAAPVGPYHYWVVGDEVSLNGGNPTSVPGPFMGCPEDTAERVFSASDYARWAAVSDPVNGTWDVELAIYHPDIKAQAKLGFNIGGSNAQSFQDFGDGDYSYSYWCWYPNVPNEPFTNPTGANDPGWYILVNTEYWPLLNFVTGPLGVKIHTLNNSIPESFGLLQNYPNPFNPSTNINFNITKQSPVTLKVYNVVGQLVSTLIDGQTFNAGKYSLKWDASNLASGIYVYRIEAEGKAASLKMMLLK